MDGSEVWTEWKWPERLLTDLGFGLGGGVEGGQVKVRERDQRWEMGKFFLV